MTENQINGLFFLLEEIACGLFGLAAIELGFTGEAFAPKAAAYRKYLRQQLDNPRVAVPTHPHPAEE